MHTQQAVIDQSLARKLFSGVPAILKELPITKGAFEGAPELEERITSSCLSYINRLQTRHQLFNDASRLSGDVDSLAQGTMMALESLPEFHALLARDVLFYGSLSTILKGYYTRAVLAQNI